MTNPVCPKTGAPMHRGVRPMTFEYKGARTLVEMPGCYCEDSGESMHTGVDMKVSDRALNRLKATTEGLPLPDERLAREESRALRENARRDALSELVAVSQELGLE